MELNFPQIDEIAGWLRRWQYKHGVQEGDVEELLRWIAKPVGDIYLSNTLKEIGKAYKLQGDEENK